MVRQAPGEQTPVSGWRLNLRQANWSKAVMNSVPYNTRRVAAGCSTGSAQSSAIQSLASPADIQPKYQAINRIRQANQMSKVPGKRARRPAPRSGRVTQFGTFPFRRSYRLTAIVSRRSVIHSMPSSYLFLLWGVRAASLKAASSELPLDAVLRIFLNGERPMVISEPVLGCVTTTFGLLVKSVVTVVTVSRG